MALIDEVKKICTRLAPQGWRDLLLLHGLDLKAADLKQELSKELPGIDLALEGFRDFAAEGKRGIEPGNPARSLLFHALASPNVVRGAQSKALRAFPTLAELETIENYVYAAQLPSLPDLQVRAQGAVLGIVVFASEYRPAPETVHRKHADMCFSRTGVSRVGTAEPLYEPERRGFLPFVSTDSHAFRALPARYSAYIAVLRKGNQASFGPMRAQTDDPTKNFWVPLHKLFSGTECLRGLDLHLSLKAHHVNEKFRRIHLTLSGTGWGEPDISNAPFIFTEGIAEWSTNPDFGTGLLAPVPHPKLVEAAVYKGKLLTFRVPANSETLFSSLQIPALSGGGGPRPAPEYVHARHKVLANGAEQDLNNQPNVSELVAAGGYQARHYLDFTGDGWIEALCPELGVSIPRRVPAYSLVTAPDFFPNCDQRELLEWTEQSVPQVLRDKLWQVPPETLADTRMAPNLQLPNAGFRAEDQTVSAIVSLPFLSPPQQRPLDVPVTNRHAYLPDAAAGIFAPGWDVSFDRNPAGVEHLASYGLGSPFPEDSKLCAALSTFWPSVAPDAARTFEPGFPTVSPLTDEEIGQTGTRAWDGVAGPRLTRSGNQDAVEYPAIEATDYVQQALDSKFSLSLTGQVDIREYEARVLAMARVYRLLGPSSRSAWTVLSFLKVAATDAELQQAQTQTGTTLQGVIYRFQMYRPGAVSPHPKDIRRRLVAVKKSEIITVLVDPLQMLRRQGSGAWERRV
jgi:hypothetical protein